jgi:hypothetical protein
MFGSMEWDVEVGGGGGGLKQSNEAVSKPTNGAKTNGKAQFKRVPCRGVGRSNAGVGGLVRGDGGVYGGGVGRDSSERTIHKGPEGVGEEVEPQFCRRRAGPPPPPPL